MSQHIPLEDLSALLDDALPEARAAQLRNHLAACAGCREALDGLSWTRGFLRAGTPPPLPPGIDLRPALPDAPAEGADPVVLPFPNRGSWWGLGAVAAMLLAAFLLRPMALRLGLGGQASEDAAQTEGAAESGAASMELAAESAVEPAPGEARPSPDIDSMVEAAGTQAVADARDPTALAPLATARHADQARIIEGPTLPPGTPTVVEPRGSEAGGYIPPEAGISGLNRPDVALLRQLALAQPRATATALAELRATVIPRLTAAAPGDDTAADAAALATAETASAQLAALLASAPEEGAAATAGDAIAAAPIPTRPVAATTSAGPSPATATTGPAPAAPATPASGPAGLATRAWVPALALMVALIALSILLTVRGRRRRRRH